MIIEMIQKVSKWNTSRRNNTTSTPNTSSYCWRGIGINWPGVGMNWPDVWYGCNRRPDTRDWWHIILCKFDVYNENDSDHDDDNDDEKYDHDSGDNDDVVDDDDDTDYDHHCWNDE